jgi:hypothetical protein
VVLNRDPHVISFDTFVAVTVYVAGSGHLFPQDRWMPRPENLRQTARGLRDDFQASRHGVEAQLIIPERLVVEVSEKPLHQLDLEADIVEPASCQNA